MHALLLLLVLVAASGSGSLLDPPPAALSVDWPSFLSRADPVWQFAGPPSPHTDKPSTAGCPRAVQCSRFPLECDGGGDSLGSSEGPSDPSRVCDGAPSGTAGGSGPLLPTRWFESAFAGNGNLGVMVTLNLTDPAHKGLGAAFIKFELGRTDVYDNRPPGANYSVGNFVYDRPRLGIGSLFLNLTGSVVGGGMRIALYDAEIVGNVTTTAGSVWFRAFVHAGMDVLVVEANFTGEEPFQPAQPFTLIPEVAGSSWAGSDPSYVPNPPAEQVAVQGGSMTTQELLTGSAYSAAFTCNTSGPLLLTLLSVSPVLASPAASQSFVSSLISAAAAAGSAQLLSDHRGWWHAYWPQSFLTMTDSRVEAFYWIQMYKLASATRANGTVFDLEGPWFVYGTYWPDLHWDLNLQLVYFPVYTSNRLDLGLSLTNFITAIAPNFAKNVPIQWADDSYAAPVGASALDALQSCYWVYGEDCLTTPPAITGNLLWVLHNFYKQFAYSQDLALLQQLFPILRKAVNFYYHFIFAAPAGPSAGPVLAGEELMAALRSRPDRLGDYTLHLPTTFSPEYSYTGPDTNYDLALLRWALQTLLIANQELGAEDPLASTWQATLSHLADYPQGPDGYWIAAGVPLNQSHRHFSHLLMIFPLETINFTDPQALQLATTSIDHWIGLTGELTGFCRTAVSSMSSLLGRRSSAYSNVTFLLDNYLHVNTMYEEGGFPCGETPPAAASSVQDMYLMSVGSEIRVFPGLSDQDLPEAAFFHLRASGGVLVSASRSNGSTAFIQAELTSGAQCTLSADLFASPFEVVPATVKASQTGPQTVSFEAQEGGWIAVFPAGTQPDFKIAPAAGQPAHFNSWGLH